MYNCFRALFDTLAQVAVCCGLDLDRLPADLNIAASDDARHG
jgi:hypothetical protein